VWSEFRYMQKKWLSLAAKLTVLRGLATKRLICIFTFTADSFFSHTKNTRWTILWKLVRLPAAGILHSIVWNKVTDISEMLTATISWNVGKLLPDYAVQHLVRQLSSRLTQRWPDIYMQHVNNNNHLSTIILIINMYLKVFHNITAIYFEGKCWLHIQSNSRHYLIFQHAGTFVTSESEPTTCRILGQCHSLRSSVNFESISVFQHTV
jgi:hypothetical protein